MSDAFDDCADLSATADRMLARSGELKVLRIVKPAEARRIAAQIEAFENRLSDFLALTEGIPKLREDAKAALAEFARARERFNLQSGGQVDALDKKFSTFLADSEKIPAQREIAAEALLKFAGAKSLLSGEAGN
jgi:hypothetical protein